MKSTLRRLARTAVLVSLLLGASHTIAQTPPGHITLVVPFPAGGPTDVIARGLAEGMQASLGQIVIVENIAGAGGTVGMVHVMRARPNGQVIGIYHVGMAVVSALYRAPPFDPLENFEPVGLVNEVPMLIVARPDFPAASFADAVAYLRANREKISYAHAGLGSASHLCGLMLQSALQVSLTTVPYKAIGTAMVDLMAGRVDITCDQTVSAGPHVTSGKVKAYGVTTAHGVERFSMLRPLATQGVADFDVSNWHALYVPKGTPQPTVERLSSALRAALADKAYSAKMADLGVINVSAQQASPEALRWKLRREIDRWTPLIRQAGAYID
jgi:tripartite-type tricarboxylate transporter receptor subunit TctC